MDATARTIRVRVKPRSSVSALEETSDGTYIARLKSAPVEGEANKELVELVARHFGCSKSSISIKSGATARTKLLKIATRGESH
jgi:uncharacterized protein YggU (UPF0235/DUF167 family)